jgi:hypothetical protein
MYRRRKSTQLTMGNTVGFKSSPTVVVSPYVKTRCRKTIWLLALFCECYHNTRCQPNSTTSFLSQALVLFLWPAAEKPSYPFWRSWVNIHHTPFNSRRTLHTSIEQSLDSQNIIFHFYIFWFIIFIIS